MPLAFTGVGKALMLDMTEDRWLDLYESGRGWHTARDTAPSTFPALKDFLARMRSYVEQSCAFDLEENEAGVRCVAAPIRDAGGAIVAAISVAGAAQYMPLERMPGTSSASHGDGCRHFAGIGMARKTGGRHCDPFPVQETRDDGTGPPHRP